MYKVRKNILPYLAFFLLIGCSKLVSQNNLPTTMPLDVTPTLSSPVLLPASPVLETPDIKILQHCFKIDDGKVDVKDLVRTGTIILENKYLLSLESGTKYPIPLTNNEVDNIHIIYFSPNHEKLAYFETLQDNEENPKSKILRVIDVRGNLLVETEFHRIDLTLHRWVNEHMLEIYTNQTINDGQVLFFNVRTQEQNIVDNSLPHLYPSAFPISDWHLEYGADLGWVVYKSTNPEQGGVGPVVWDVVDKKILWQSSSMEYEFARPAWSPEGDEVAISTNDKLYIVNRGGQSRIAIDAGDDFSIDYLSWSPDARFIAFRSASKVNLESTLLIYDTQMNQTTDYCIISDGTYSATPEWLANSYQLIIAIWKRQDDQSLSGETIFIDLEQALAYQIK
jgi:hypothetical protein